MEKHEKNPITQSALERLELRKKFITECSDRMTVLFMEQVQTALGKATQEMKSKHHEILEHSLELLKDSNSISINPEELTGEQTGNICDEKI